MKPKNPCIGICFARTQDSTDIELLHALCEDMKCAGMRTLTFQFMSDLKNEDSKDAGELVLLKLIPFSNLDAMILFSESIKNTAVIDAIVSRVTKEGIPVISIARPLEGCFQVQYEMENPFRDVMEHILTEHGCKKVAFLAGIKDNSFSEARLRIYREALAAHDIPYDEKLVKYGDFWYAPAKEAVQEYLREYDKNDFPDAICCANDAMAMTVCQELENAGYRVPQDVLVTGFDGTYSEQFFRPRLTTAAIDFAGISRETTALLQRIFAEPGLEPCSVTVAYQMRVGQSCGCKEVIYGDTGKQLMNVYLNLEGSRFFYTAMHDMTSKMLEEIYPIEELPQRILESNFGIAWTRASLVLTRQTVLGLGLHLEPDALEHPTVEVCRWSELGNSTPMKAFTSDFLVDDPEQLYAEAKSNAVMVTALHEQGQVLGYFVMAYEPATPDFDDNKLDYGRLLNYQSSIAHILSALISRHSLMEFNAQLERLYIYDPMTNLNNRRGFFQHLSYVMSERKMLNDDFWVCIAAIDMDGLKYINDTFGHAEGDDAIIAISQILMKVSPRGSIVARFGGDEFMIATLLESKDPHFEPMFRRDMQVQIDAYNRTIEKEYCIGASCGFEIAKYTEGMDIDVVMKAADDQLYLDKARHKCLRGIRRKP